MIDYKLSGADYAEKVFEALKGKKPFIYRVDSNTYYIGCAVCRTCTVEERALFEAYQKEYQKLCVELAKHPRSLDFSSGNQLNEILQQILTLPGSAFCYNDKDEAFGNLIKLLKSQSVDELQKLESQIQDFHIALDFSDGKFYKYQ